MNQGDTLLHLVAGGIGGTVGAIITCPLEVIKTRLQSSAFSIRTVTLTPSVQFSISTGDVIRPENNPPRVLKVLRNILEKEGVRSLFRGLGPNLVGVAPTRAIYFGAYASAKEGFSRVLEPGTARLHICAATIAGFISITATNPMWVIKTRLQLDTGPLDAPGSTTLQCMRRIYHSEGFRGFYRGMSASYAGISETVIYFVVYEELKRQLKKGSSTEESLHFLGIMGAGTVSKICASCIAYPHEVVRTRLREEGNRYHSFIQTVRLVAAEEGIGAFYRGLLAQLARQIPNTAVMMATYELIVHLAKETRGPEAAAMSIAEGRSE